MMKKLFIFILLFFLYALPAAAQFPVINAEQVQGWMKGPRTALIIDVRSPEEYRQGHIPGAVNIPAERMFQEQGRLPKDRTTPLVFYCRGAG